MVMVGRKTFKVSQVGGLDCLSRCVSTIPPLLPPYTPVLLPPPLAFVLTVSIAHSTLSLVLECTTSYRYFKNYDTVRVKAELLSMQFRTSN